MITKRFSVTKSHYNINLIAYLFISLILFSIKTQIKLIQFKYRQNELIDNMLNKQMKRKV